jgi:RND family efflux transporter MFP subunit
LESARASVQKARADRDRALADVRAARSRVEVVTADARRADAMQGYAKIRAPYDGVITARKVNTGALVQPSAGAGDWLFRVARLDPVRVVVAVPEADAEVVRDQAEVRLTVQALGGPPLAGKVARTSWALEPGPRTLRAEIDLPNKNGLLRPGMYAYARISNTLPEGWTLPVAAVAKQGDATACFVIEDGKAVRTPVQLGRGDGQSVVVLKKQKPGSPPTWEDVTGTEAVAAKAAGLSDGQPVKAEAGP